MKRLANDMSSCADWLRAKFGKVETGVTLPLVICLLGVIACGEAIDSPPAVAVLDSAGVRIVSVQRSAIRSVGPGALVPGPPLGVESQGVPALLSTVRGVATSSEGTVFVADRDMAVRVFDAEGGFGGRYGGWGSGPGEFREISWIRPFTDGEAAVYDPVAGRVTTLSSDGGVAITPVQVPGVFFDISRDRRLIGVGMPPAERADASGGRWAVVPIIVVTASPGEAASVDTIGHFQPFPCAEGLPGTCGPGAGSPGVRATPAGVVYYDAMSREIIERRLDGKMLQVVRLELPGAIADLFADRSGDVWIETIDTATGTRQWLRVSPARGEATAAIVASSLDLAAALNGRAVWVSRDSLGVPTVRVGSEPFVPR